jgi:hypothetical protein
VVCALPERSPPIPASFKSVCVVCLVGWLVGCFILHQEALRQIHHQPGRGLAWLPQSPRIAALLRNACMIDIEERRRKNHTKKNSDEIKSEMIGWLVYMGTLMSQSMIWMSPPQCQG